VSELYDFFLTAKNREGVARGGINNRKLD